jgi:hypothetical protein
MTFLRELLVDERALNVPARQAEGGRVCRAIRAKPKIIYVESPIEPPPAPDGLEWGRKSGERARGHRYRVVDVFTQQPLEGNPLAVFPDAADLDSVTMQQSLKN